MREECDGPSALGKWEGLFFPVERIWYEAAKRRCVLNPDAVRYIDNLLARPG